LPALKQYKRNLESVFYKDPTKTDFDWATIGSATLDWAQAIPPEWSSSRQS
jgi:hypothetical protein